MHRADIDLADFVLKQPGHESRQESRNLSEGATCNYCAHRSCSFSQYSEFLWRRPKIFVSACGAAHREQSVFQRMVDG
jgi:hypothetical protein